MTNKYHIRYNTKDLEGNYPWRIFENGREILCKSIRIEVPVFDECTVEHNVKKYNIACEGQLLITNGNALIYR